MDKIIKNINDFTFKEYGTIIEYDSNNSNNFQVIVNETDSEGWRIAVSKISQKEIFGLGRHPNSRESFEPLVGTTLIYVAKLESPEDYEIFLLDKPVCLYKNIWHATTCLSEYSVVKITENINVETQRYTLL